MKAAAGQQRADDVRECERANVRAIDFFEVVGAGRLQLDGEPRRAGVGELFGMNARDEASGASRGEDLARLRDGECAAIAENVAKFGEAGHRDGGNPALDQQIHVGVGAAAKFPRHHVRAEKRE